jgi:hypothetical protein
MDEEPIKDPTTGRRRRLSSVGARFQVLGEFGSGGMGVVAVTDVTETTLQTQKSELAVKPMAPKQPRFEMSESSSRSQLLGVYDGDATEVIEICENSSQEDLRVKLQLEKHES